MIVAGLTLAAILFALMSLAGAMLAEERGDDKTFFTAFLLALVALCFAFAAGWSA